MAGHDVFRLLVLGASLVALAGCAASPLAATASSYNAPASAQALKGSTPQVLAADFGPPMLRRTDGPAQVWVYQSSVCGLQVFLYPDATGTPRVAAAVPDNGNPSACMRSFARPVTDAALERASSS